MPAPIEQEEGELGLLTLIGLLTIVCLVALLLSGRMSPVLPLIMVPLLGAFCAGDRKSVV